LIKETVADAPSPSRFESDREIKQAGREAELRFDRINRRNNRWILEDGFLRDIAREEIPAKRVID
jgi:hypothetical protein